MASFVFKMVFFVTTSAALGSFVNDSGCSSQGEYPKDRELKNVDSLSLSLLQTRFQLQGTGDDNPGFHHKKSEYDRLITQAYTRAADELVGENFTHLHLGSGYGPPYSYLSDEQFDELVMDAAGKMNPQIQENDTVFELGMGVGAALKVLATHFPGLRFGGSDLTEEAVKVARKALKGPGATLPMLVLDMRSKHTSIPNGSFDHVLSLGALAVYLEKDEMLTAIAEATRMTKPGGSLLFSMFVEAHSKARGEIKTPVEKSFWAESLPKLGLENVEVHGMKNNWDRYIVTCRKKDKL